MPSGECELIQPARFGVKKAGNPARHGGQVGRALASPVKNMQRVVRRSLLDTRPEVAQPSQAVFRGVAGDQRGIDRADRRADHPVGLDAGLVQRFVDTHLVGAKRAAPLQHEHDLPGNSRLAQAWPSAAIARDAPLCLGRFVVARLAIVVHVRLSSGRPITGRSSRRRSG